MADRVADWAGLVARRYPPADAQSWDRVGLQVGAPDDPVTRVLVTLDVTEQVLDEAAEVGADLVLAHHPLLLRGVERLTPDTAPGRLALRAARQGVAVLAAHTNHDVAARGTTEPTVEALGLREVVPLRPQRDPDAEICKLTTFVPTDATDAVAAALSEVGAGVIGEYEQCTFRVTGTGTFKPSAQSAPALGERETLNRVEEERLEVEVARADLEAAVAALERAHPYEEVAFDVYQLVPVGDPGPKGLGRIGVLPEPCSLRTVADTLASALPAPHLRVAGDLERTVRTVAACGGAGDALIDDAHRAGADVYVTGDLRHHPMLDALTQGLALVDAGHYATEAAALPEVRAALDEDARGQGLSSGVVVSQVRTEPWASYRPPAGPAGGLAPNPATREEPT
ncbi:Nif3-like dinuclear metal center hexameric protein [Egibacter rhizosphaerae]|uniref:GTP cyclohydrolase 1 type 2 homolog n=1 Tax=Egibacter rhizosphaerae TaxID=1670831 RepID=A0A411YAR2_9ACTN|nr:Nif3-like dinuclear metal center hexameric protein [Egibacter rhizosphaerae]QBI18267.1 Nif3-like dinuclear metal center hexameric protein [Egibacter rhizosphaerae]